MKCGLNVDRICPRCGEAYESMVHLMRTCQENKTLWRLSHLRVGVKDWANSFIAWCKCFAKSRREERAQELLLMFVWQIWNDRNMWCLNGK